LLLQDGLAYPTVYTSTPVAHLAYLFSLAAQARDNSLGVWADDLTGEFALEDRSSTSPSRDENDRLIVCGGIESHLNDLLVQANNDVRFQADLLDIVFVEK
jgi:hypothetical protein